MTRGSRNRILEFNLDFVTLSSREPEYWYHLVNLKQLVFTKNNMEITGGNSACYCCNYKEDPYLQKSVLKLVDVLIHILFYHIGLFLLVVLSRYLPILALLNCENNQ